MNKMKSKKNAVLFKLLVVVTLFCIYFFFYLNDKKLSVKVYNTKNETETKTKKNKIKACIIILVRNFDLSDLIKTMKKFEDNFNNKYNYPYILMNNELFTDNFRKEIVKHTKSKIEFELIPIEYWSVPDWINKKKFEKNLKQLYKWPTEYRLMCRFFSGFFFRIESTLKYDYFMRIDSHVNFPCQLLQDPFEKLYRENKKYGFILTNEESLFTIPTLWDSVMKWYGNRTKLNSQLFKYLKDTMCIFYNNFEVGSFSLFRSKDYLTYFNYLDKKGGFFYERWVFIYIFNFDINKLKIKKQI